jgi:hypothetical protein
MANAYWIKMVKDAIGCDEDWAVILLEFEFEAGGGWFDFSEATTKELNEYWKMIDAEYKDSLKEVGNVAK